MPLIDDSGLVAATARRVDVIRLSWADIFHMGDDLEYYATAAKFSQKYKVSDDYSTVTTDDPQIVSTEIIILIPRPLRPAHCTQLSSSVFFRSLYCRIQCFRLGWLAQLSFSFFFS